MASIFLEGLLLQASLIFALGAQNLYVLESGMNKQNPVAVSFVCFFCDLLLITLGVAGAGSLFSSYATLKILIGVLGAFFLFCFGLKKIICHDVSLESPIKQTLRSNLGRSVLMAITFSLFNPHAYLDAFILIGGYSTKYHILSQRMVLGFGAATFSLVWFLSLSGASGFIKPLFFNHKKLKIVSMSCGVLLLFLSFRLSADVLSWMVNDPHQQNQVKALNTLSISFLSFSSN